MKKTLIATFAALLLGLGAIAAADSVSMVWSCTLKEGVTPAQSQASGKKWVALARKLTGNNEITSSWVTAVVGDAEGFMWVDTYPSLEVWAALQAAWPNSAEAAALDDEFNANESCPENRLYRSVVVD